MSLAHLSTEDLALWNELNREVGRLSKLARQERDEPRRELHQFNARTAAAVRDRIGAERQDSRHDAFCREARELLSSGLWYESSVHGGEC